MPVSVTLDAALSTVASARIGTGGAPAGIKIRVNDSALGISLADRTRQMCGSRDPCVLWLEGIWRGRGGGVGRFDVFKVHRAIERDELPTASYVEYEVR